MSDQRAIDRIRQAFYDAGLTVREKGRDKFRAQAPGHSPADDSLVFWQLGDHVAMSTYADEDKMEILAAVGLTAADLYDNPKIGRTWDYPDGRKVTRKPMLGGSKMKTFDQKNARGKKSLLRVDFPAEAVVYVVEGEGKVDALESVGATATCSAGGGNSAQNADWSPLHGHRVVIVLDDDKTGETFGRTVAEKLDELHIDYQVARCAPKCHDITDHLAADHGLDELQMIGGGEARPRIWKATDLHPASQPSWLAKGRLPRAAVSLLVGDEGIGKSLFWVWIASAITRGKALPEFGVPARDPADVLIVVTEDEWSPTILPRLIVAGADLDRVQVICTEADGSGSPVFPRDLYLLDDPDPRPALIVVDAWLDTVPASISVKDPQQARQALHPWKETATRTGAAVMLLTHTNRVASGNARDKYGITGELRKKARLTLFAQQDDEGFLVIGPEKANTTSPVPAARFTIDAVQHFDPTDEDDGTIGTLRYVGDSDRTAREHIVDSHDGDDSTGSRTEAEAWLLDYLTEYGWAASAEAKKDGAKALRVSEKTISRAAKSLRVVTEARGFPRTTHWSLPDLAAGIEDHLVKAAESSQDSQDSSQDTDPPVSLEDVPTVPTGHDQGKRDVPTVQSGQSGQAPGNGDNQCLVCPHCDDELKFADDIRDGYHTSTTACVTAERKATR